MNTVAARHPATGALCTWYKLEEICTKDRDWLGAQGVHARPRHYDDLVDWLNGAGDGTFGITPEFIERMVRLHATVSAATARLGLEEICDRIAEQVTAKLLETLPAALFSQCQNRMRAIAMEVIDQATSPAQGGEA